MFRFFYSIWIFVILCLSVLAGHQDWIGSALLFGAFAVVLLGWLIFHDLWQLHNDELDNRAALYDKRSRFIIAMTSTTAEHRKFLAVEWPELGVDLGVENIVYLLENGNNTGVLMEFLRKFLEDSNEVEFTDLRNYNDDKFLQARFDCSRDYVRAQWEKATTLLRRMGYLKIGSMAGNHTYQWTSKGHYKKLVRQYAVVPVFENLNAEAV